MEARSLFYLTVILVILGITSLPVLAIGRSQRYPTAAEIQQLIRQFRQQASTPAPEGSICCTGSERDLRSSATRRVADSFVRAWSRVNPDIAPFLGMWVSNNSSVTVYPSNVRGRACVILAGNEDNYEYFSTATFHQGHLRLNDGVLASRVLVRQRNQFGTPFLLSTGIYDRVPNFTIYIDVLAYIRDRPAQVLSSPNLRENSRIYQQFNAAGCTASLPNRR